MLCQPQPITACARPELHPKLCALPAAGCVELLHMPATSGMRQQSTASPTPCGLGRNRPNHCGALLNTLANQMVPNGATACISQGPIPSLQLDLKYQYPDANKLASVHCGAPKHTHPDLWRAQPAHAL